MGIRIKYHLLICFVLLLVGPGCTRDDFAGIDPEKEVFNFIVTDDQRKYINATRGLQYEITDPVPELEFAGDTYTIDRFEIRGDNTLNFHRKGFGINLGKKILLYDTYGQEERKFEEFKLLAMVYDFTYIENCIGTGLFREVGLWPVFSFFTEVRLNNISQGLYHFIEDPFEYFIEQENASFVLRRGYDHVIKAWSVNPEKAGNEEIYSGMFKKIYSDLPRYSGKQLFDSLSSVMDLQEYFTKLSIDLLIKNGDYTDEIIFYTKPSGDREIFGFFPWDLDDLFADQPHEIGNPWAPGTVFGNRDYFSMEDITRDVGSKLLYSIEEDIDYKIAKDDYLYGEYLKTLRSVMTKLNETAINRIFDYTFEHIGAFYSNQDIIRQSVYDVDETDYDLFVSNISDKRQQTIERRNYILRELDIQQHVTE